MLSYEIRFITHDGAMNVVNNLGAFDVPMDRLGRIEVGKNVFIGAKCMIMPGVKIGDNCIIGAGSIVTKNIPANSVAVGSPAKVVSTIDEYVEKMKNSSMIYPTWGVEYEKKKKYCMENVGFDTHKN